MSDLIVATAAVGVVCVLMLGLGYRIGGARSRRAGVVALVLVAVFYGGYFLFLRDSVLLLRLVPVSSVPIAGDPAPWLASLTAGVLLAQRRVPVRRRVLIAGVVVAAGWHGPVSIFTRTAPQTHNSWAVGVCLQTSRSSCGPAALATLLKHHGVETTETHMTKLCLTGENGTHLAGLYRGLSLMAPDGATPRAARLSVNDLRDRPHRLPAVASLMLTQALADTDPRYTRQWGWDVGVMHTVVVLGFEEGGRVRMADPGVGPERWSQRGLEELWTGEVLYLEADG